MKIIKHCNDDHCLTCADTLLSVRVVKLAEEVDMAVVEINEQQEEVDISLIGQVVSGDILLVHGGVALARQTARDVLEGAEQAR